MIDAIACVLPMGNKWYIGKDNDLLFKIPNDLAFFKNAQYQYSDIICGYKTYKTLPSYILDRDDVTIWVLTESHQNEITEDNTIPTNKDSILELAKQFNCSGLVIGGAEIYTLLLPYINNFFATVIRDQSKYDEASLSNAAYIPNLEAFPKIWTLADVIYTLSPFQCKKEQVHEYVFAQFVNHHCSKLQYLMPKNILSKKDSINFGGVIK